MASLTLRTTKGAALTHSELDTNFTNINTEVGNLTSSVSGKVASVNGSANRINVSGTTTPTIDLASITAPGSATLANITVDAYGRITAYTSSSVNEYSDGKARLAISVTDNGGDGSLSYNNTTGVITYQGPGTTEYRAAFTAGTGITITDGAISTTITQYTDTNARASISAGTGISYNSTTGAVSVDSTIATKTYADSAASTAVAAVIDAAPTTLDTLNELAAALGDDPNFATTVTTSLGNKLNTSAFTSTADTWLGTKSTTNLAEGTNQYFTQARARTSVSAGTGISYNSTTGVITSSITQYTDALARAALSGGTGISYNSTTGVITSSITQYTDTNARAALSAGTGISYNSSTGVITSSITQYTDTNARAALSGSTGISYNSTTGAIALSSGVATAGTYAGRVTVDTYGRITSATNDITGHTEPIFNIGTTGGTIAPNAANGAVQQITLNSALTINGFTSPVAGQAITLIIYGGTAYTSITSTMKFAGGVKTLTGTAGCIDILSIYYDGTTYFASLGKGYA